MKASISPKDIPVSYSCRPDVGREFLTVDCPNGWDDVKRISNKVLTYDGRKFTFTGWNSDRNEAYFAKPLDGTADVAVIG